MAWPPPWALKCEREGTGIGSAIVASMSTEAAQRERHGLRKLLIRYGDLFERTFGRTIRHPPEVGPLARQYRRQMALAKELQRREHRAQLATAFPAMDPHDKEDLRAILIGLGERPPAEPPPTQPHEGPQIKNEAGHCPNRESETVTAQHLIPNEVDDEEMHHLLWDDDEHPTPFALFLHRYEDPDAIRRRLQR